MEEEQQMAYHLLYLSCCKWHVTTAPDCDPNVTKKDNWEYVCDNQTPVQIHLIQIFMPIKIAQFKPLLFFYAYDIVNSKNNNRKQVY